MAIPISEITDFFKKYTAAAGGIAAFDCVYMLAAGTVGKACSTAVGTVYAIGFAPAAITAAASGNIQTAGVITTPAWTLTPGLPVFIHTTAGQISQTPPSINGYQAQMVGVALNDTHSIQIMIGPVVEVSTGVVSVAAGKTLTVSNTMTLAGADDTAAPTFPAGAGTVVYSGGNITGTAGHLTNDVYHGYGNSGAGAVTLDFSTYAMVGLTINGTAGLTLTHPSFPSACQILLTNGGSAAFTWTTSVKWPAATPPTFTASGLDIVTLIWNGTYWYGTAVLAMA